MVRLKAQGSVCVCVWSGLQVIFTQFQYSDKASLHPAALRKALADTFANQQRFQLGHMDDAAECFVSLLGNGLLQICGDMFYPI